MIPSHGDDVTVLKTFRRSRNVCRTLAVIALVGCAGTHAAKVHARTVRPAHGASRLDSAPHQIPSVPEPKPLVGELMA
jgi:hypothetical protein